VQSFKTIGPHLYHLRSLQQTELRSIADSLWASPRGNGPCRSARQIWAPWRILRRWLHN